MYNISYGRKEPLRIMTKQSDEMNPKILPLDKLVHLIDSNVLAYYLEQISIFLRNTKKDLWFPKITPNLDAFLVRVIRDVQNMQLLLKHFDEKSKGFALQIIDSLIENENVYQLMHSYESCKIDMDILVYKKVYLDKSDSMLASRVKMCSIKPSTEKEASDPLHRKPRQEFIFTPSHSRSFKSQWITIILSFIRDKTRQTIEYPAMSYNEADYIYSLIQRDKLEDNDPLYASLWNELNLFLELYDIKTSFLYIANDRVQISLEKRPRNKKKSDEKSSLNTSKSSEDLDSKLSKTQKRKKLVESLDKSFVNTALQMIYDFISNEAEASLVFKNANDDQCSFIQCACAIAKSKKYTSFDDRGRLLLRGICDRLSANTVFDLNIVIAKMNKNDFLRSVSLKKEPKATFNNRNSQPTKFQEGTSETKNGYTASGEKNTTPNKENMPSVCENIPSKGKENGGKAGNKDNYDMTSKVCETPSIKGNESAQETTNKENSLCNISENQATNEFVEKSANKENVSAKASESRSGRSEIAQKVKEVERSAMRRSASVPRPAGRVGIDNGSVVKTIDNNTIKLFGRKARLLEALSMPIESDIGMRMMRQMGWHGGPLGTRGEGITEPIMPAIHLAPGAGLGHLKPEKKKKKEKSVFVELLQEIHLLLTQDALERDVQYTSPLSKKEREEVQRILLSFSKRAKIQVNSMIVNVVDVILQELTQMPHVRLDCAFSNDKKLLKLQKITDQSKASFAKSIQRVAENQPIKIPHPKEISIPEPITRTWFDEIGMCYTPNFNPKNIRQLGFKIGVLFVIKCFLKRNNLEMTKHFDHDLNKVQVKFIKETVKRFCRGEFGCFGTGAEKTIATDIREAMKEAELTVSVEKKRLILQKTLKQKNLVKSAKEVCDITNNNNNLVDKNKCKEDCVAKEQKSTVNGSKINISSKDTEVSKEESQIQTKDKVKDSKEAVKDEQEKVMKLVEELPEHLVSESDDEIFTSVASKRSRSDSINSANVTKKTKFLKNLTVLHIKSDDKITDEIARKFQASIVEKLDLEAELPLIECYGIQSGSLIYGCYNEVGVLFIESVASELELKTTKGEYKEKRSHVLQIKLNSFIGVNLKKLFCNIEAYNKGLSTDLWSVTDVQTHGDFIVIVADIDEISMQYIINAKFSLFAGIDKLRMSILWN